MAKIDSFMMFDQLSNIQMSDGKMAMQYLNPQPVLRPQFIPGNFTFAFCLAVRDIDFTQENTVNIRIDDPNGKTVYKMDETKSPITTEESNLPAEYRGFAINANMHNFVFESQGIYHLIVTVNGNDIEPAEVPVFLKERK